MLFFKNNDLLQIILRDKSICLITPFGMKNEAFYKNWIQEELVRRCEKNSRYSLRSYARSLGVDVAALSRILSNRLVPSLKMAQKIVQKLGLPPDEEKNFLSSLAQAHRSKGAQRINPAFRKMDSASTEPIRELSIDLFRVIAEWYHLSILELSFVPGFKSDSNWIAFELGITPLEAKLAVERLVSLGLLEENTGKLKKTDAHISTADKHLTTPAHRRRQKQVLEKAIYSLEHDPIEERSNTSMALAIDPKKLPEAKQLIEEFNDKMTQLLTTESQEQVYEFTVALFPIQKRREK